MTYTRYETVGRSESEIMLFIINHFPKHIFTVTKSKIFKTLVLIMINSPGLPYLFDRICSVASLPYAVTLLVGCSKLKFFTVTVHVL